MSDRKVSIPQPESSPGSQENEYVSLGFTSNKKQIRDFQRFLNQFENEGIKQDLYSHETINDSEFPFSSVSKNNRVENGNPEKFYKRLHSHPDWSGFKKDAFTKSQISYLDELPKPIKKDFDQVIQTYLKYLDPDPWENPFRHKILPIRLYPIESFEKIETWLFDQKYLDRDSGTWLKTKQELAWLITYIAMKASLDKKKTKEAKEVFEVRYSFDLGDMFKPSKLKEDKTLSTMVDSKLSS